MRTIWFLFNLDILTLNVIYSAFKLGCNKNKRMKLFCRLDTLHNSNDDNDDDYINNNNEDSM